MEVASNRSMYIILIVISITIQTVSCYDLQNYNSDLKPRYYLRQNSELDVFNKYISDYEIIEENEFNDKKLSSDKRVLDAAA